MEFHSQSPNSSSLLTSIIVSSSCSLQSKILQDHQNSKHMNSASSLHVCGGSDIWEHTSIEYLTYSIYDQFMFWNIDNNGKLSSRMKNLTTFVILLRLYMYILGVRMRTCQYCMCCEAWWEYLESRMGICLFSTLMHHLLAVILCSVVLTWFHLLLQDRHFCPWEN